MSVEAGAFWRWSNGIYGAAGVKDRLLKLQDAQALNVNVLLWCCWIAETFEPPADLLLRKAADLAAEWTREVTGPLRAARRALKSPPRQVGRETCAALRDKIASVELAAEEVEQSLLERLALDELAQRRETANPYLVARRTLVRYAALAGAVGRPGFSTLILDDLARAVFPDAQSEASTA